VFDILCFVFVSVAEMPSPPASLPGEMGVSHPGVMQMLSFLPAFQLISSATATVNRQLEI